MSTADGRRSGCILSSVISLLPYLKGFTGRHGDSLCTRQPKVRQSQMLTWIPAATLEQMTEAGAAALLLMPARKIRKYPVGRVRIVKIAVFTYLIMGSMPTAAKHGFENGQPLPNYLFLSVDIVMAFFAVLTVQRNMDRESRQLLALRQYTFAAQTEAPWPAEAENPAVPPRYQAAS